MAERRRLFERLSWPEAKFLTRELHNEATGGLLLLLAASAALLWANLDPGSYDGVSGTKIGPPALHLDLSIATWAADGLLAVFFLVVGLELKRELVVGELRRPAAAALPIVAAVCGMLGPIAIYLIVNTRAGGDPAGWAVPTATDIAFALAVLAVIGSRLPTALRAFLLTLAVVDDLLAISIIAVFFTSGLDLRFLAGALALLALYAWLQKRRVSAWWIYVPLFLTAWGLTHESGVHATVTGVAFGLLTRVRHNPGEDEGPAERLEHRLRPFSAGLCVPAYALFAAGITVSADSLRAVFTEPVGLGVVLGLVLGKGLGIFGGTFLAARFSHAQLSPDLSWSDVLGVGVLAGIGFTVSLLIGELAFEGDTQTTQLVKSAVLVGSLLSAMIATVILSRRNAVYRRISADESVDSDHDGVPDVYEPDETGRPAD
ncbi:MAG TPA: Na+/H+ antiporter NhaA [Jiangellaceae bacterium]|nr:Na+/H+ antiporter NhaA [Jiangellaceae bacterium]